MTAFSDMVGIDLIAWSSSV